MNDKNAGIILNNQMVKLFFSAKNSIKQNIKVIYRLILRQGPVTADTIINKTNIKSATCARLLDELAQHDLILTNEFGESTGGRKPILYRINPNMGYLIGIEVTGIFSTILLMNIDLTIIDKIKLKISDVSISSALLDIVITNIEALMLKHKLIVDDLIGIGISSDDLLYHLSDVDIKEKSAFIKASIYQHLPTYITIGSGTNFAAIAEHKLHYAHTSKRFLFTRCDAEIHSSTIIDGTIPFTQTGMTDAFGHTTIDINGSACFCGSFGCLYQYSSLPAIKSKIIQLLASGMPSIINDWTISADEIDYHVIFKALEMNDILCVNVLEEAAYYYSVALFNFILAFQPDTVVCGGTLVPKSLYFNVIKENIENKVKLYPQLKTKIYPAADSYDIVSQGAGGMVLEQILK